MSEGVTYCPSSGLCRVRESLSRQDPLDTGRNRLFPIVIGSVDQAHNKACARVTGILGPVSRHNFNVATGLGLGLDDQGRDRVRAGTGRLRSRQGSLSR